MFGLSMLKRFHRLHPSVLTVIASEFCLQMTHNAFFLLANFYMSKHGFTDAKIAELLSLRFLVVLLLSLPLGFVLRSMPLLPLLRGAAVAAPIGYGLLLASVPAHHELGLYAANALIGISMSIFQVLVVPYIMRHEERAQQTDAIALSFSNWSSTTFVLGLSFYLLNHGRAVPIEERTLLLAFLLWAVLGLGLLLRPLADERPIMLQSENDEGTRFEWALIAKVLAPSAIIGIGAGLSIPFISLFFRNAFHMGYENFALVSSLTTFFVSLGSIYGPTLQKRYGYRIAIIGTQSLAIVALAFLGISDLFAPARWALALAIGCYVLRQPLMNMANPVISEWTMHQVGPRNRELTSALKQAIWAASWFSSSQIFRILRDAGLSYVWVFCSTAAIYALGVGWYAQLISGGKKA